jgi:hypothetical protein
LISGGTPESRVPHSFAFFANEWVTASSPRPKLPDRKTLVLQRHS